MIKQKAIIILPALLICIQSFSQGWIQRANFGGSARFKAVGFSIADSGYIGTGYAGAYPGTNDFWRYVPATDTWTQMANYGGGGRGWATGFSIGNLGYIGTGENCSGCFLNTFWEYNSQTNVWTQRTNFGGAARTIATGFAIADSGYIGTGGNPLRNDFWKFDPSVGINGTWTQMANFPGNAREGATGLSIGNMGYLGLGHNGSSYLNDFWQYNPTNNTWTQKANFGGVARRTATGFSIGNHGYVGTGSNGTYQNDFWEYTPGAGVMGGTWTQLCVFGGAARSDAASFSIGSNGYIGTGWNGAALNDFWEVQPICGGALPIELLSFSAQWQDESYNAAVIEWQTANEFNNDYFEIERSTDAINFHTIMQIDGLNNVEITDYSELDTDPFKETVSYYRLKQVDYDGAFTYSQIEALNIPEGLEIINLYPNPVGDLLNFSLLSSETGTIEIGITNALGQNVFAKSESINKGVTLVNIDLPNIGDGNYYLNITLESGEHRTQRKFIVNQKQ